MPSSVARHGLYALLVASKALGGQDTLGSLQQGGTPADIASLGPTFAGGPQDDSSLD
jgi:hypothetical protein